MNGTEQDTPQEWFHDLGTHYVEAQALFHLNQVGAFVTLLKEGPLASDELAQRLGLVPGILAALLEYVAGVDELLAQDSQGRFFVTDYGKQVFERFGRQDQDGERHINLFDVRVGAYGPVWGALEGMLRGELVYGRDVQRKGQYAAEATYKISPRMAPMVIRFTQEFGIERLVEIGVPTGLLAYIAGQIPSVELIGLDIDDQALREAKERSLATGAGRIRFQKGNVFDVEPWFSEVDGPKRGAFVTVHMHELASVGLDAIAKMIQDLSRRFAGWHLLALEQDRLPLTDRTRLPRDQWLYGQSNVLIHHLIRNARILTRDEWLALFNSKSSRVVAVQEVGYLGYSGYIIELTGG